MECLPSESMLRYAQADNKASHLNIEQQHAGQTLTVVFSLICVKVVLESVWECGEVKVTI